MMMMKMMIDSKGGTMKNYIKICSGGKNSERKKCKKCMRSISKANIARHTILPRQGTTSRRES